MWLLAYIPNVLAYAFITLLVCILCFILVYISHKLYLIVNEKLQVIAVTETPSEFRKKLHSAVTVIVLYEKCYLVVHTIYPQGEGGPSLLRFSESYGENLDVDGDPTSSNIAS